MNAAMLVAPIAMLATASLPPRVPKKVKPVIVIGCLGGPIAEGVYSVKTKTGDVEVGGVANFKSHVGHEVKLTGAWSTSGAAGENDTADKQPAAAANDAGAQLLKVTKIEVVSDTCLTQ